jgi:hypothetical protein
MGAALKGNLRTKRENNKEPASVAPVTRTADESLLAARICQTAIIATQPHAATKTGLRNVF